jgi:cytochrome P450
MAEAATASRTTPTALPTAVPSLPGRLPLLGNMLQFRRDRLALHDVAAGLGPIARMWLGPIGVDIVTDADVALQILVDEAASFKKARGMTVFLKPLLGDGLLSADAELHKRHRKLLAPAFAPKRIAAYGTTMVDETIQQVATWKHGATIDVAAEMMQLTLAIAGRTLFSADIRGDAAVVDKGLTLAMRSLISNLTSWARLPYPWPLPRHLQMKRAIKLLDDVVYRLIREGRERGTDSGDVMSMLLLARDDEDGTGLTDRQVRDEVMTLLLAGHETTANTLAWTWYELGRNPHVAAALRTEVLDVVGERAPTVEDLPRLPYTLQVIEESMRLHPPAYVTAREVLREVEVGGHRYPRGSTMLINIRGIHQRADYYPDPLAFKPERMATAEKKARPRGRYLPFGAGPRVCIGSHFALIEAQLAMAAMVQRVRLEPRWTAPIEPEPLVTLRPRGGVPMQVAVRT